MLPLLFDRSQTVHGLIDRQLFKDRPDLRRLFSRPLPYSWYEIERRGVLAVFALVRVHVDAGEVRQLDLSYQMAAVQCLKLVRMEIPDLLFGQS